jgi:HPt (histidine-containing phosphotransfer) domain-containing protein
MSKDDDGPIETLLADLWQRQLPLLHERLDLLDRTAAEASTGALSEETRAEAFAVAHKLSGSLGMFGYHQGTETARAMEQILRVPTPETLFTLASLAVELRKSVQPDLLKPSL